MQESLVFLFTSFWLGAVHAATPGHGKTIAASYIVGVRGRPVDAVVLGIFVTLSHTSGILLVAALATMGSAWFIPQRIEAYLAVATGLLVIAIGCWMLRTQLRLLLSVRGTVPDLAEADHPGTEAHPHDHGGPPDSGGDHSHHPHYHSHGWGMVHTHDVGALLQSRPSLGALLALGVAGGLLPDPGALAILLAALGEGRVVLGLLTVIVFSLGFASVLVIVGIVAARLGQLILDWLSSRWIACVQVGAAVLIILVGVVLTANAWRTLASFV